MDDGDKVTIGIVVATAILVGGVASCSVITQTDYNDHAGKAFAD